MAGYFSDTSKIGKVMVDLPSVNELKIQEYMITITTSPGYFGL